MARCRRGATLEERITAAVLSFTVLVGSRGRWMAPKRRENLWHLRDSERMSTERSMRQETQKEMGDSGSRSY